MSKKILILLATHNGERYISQQLKSIKDQKEVEVDVLVSDDKSSDKTINMIKIYEAEMNIKYLNRKESDITHGSAQNFYDLIKYFLPITSAAVMMIIFLIMY